MIPLLVDGKTFDLLELVNLRAPKVMTYFPYARLAYSDDKVQSYQIEGVEVFGLPAAPMSLTFKDGILMGVHFIYEIKANEHSRFRLYRHQRRTVKAVSSAIKKRAKRPNHKERLRIWENDNIVISYDIFQRISLEETIKIIWKK